MILKDYDCETSSSHQALEMLQSRSFAVIIVGQSVAGEKALEVINAAKALDPPPAIIAIRFDHEAVELGVETHKCNFGENPGWLSQRVAFLLAKRGIAD